MVNSLRCGQKFTKTMPDLVNAVFRKICLIVRNKTFKILKIIPAKVHYIYNGIVKSASDLPK